MDRKEKIADDILVGAEAIASETGLRLRQVYAKQTELGITHLGGLLVGSKSRLREILTGKRS
jgi:hypothetical protein